jgi:hypothetical protein
MATFSGSDPSRRLPEPQFNYVVKCSNLKPYCSSNTAAFALKLQR